MYVILSLNICSTFVVPIQKEKKKKKSKREREKQREIEMLRLSCMQTDNKNFDQQCVYGVCVLQQKRQTHEAPSTVKTEREDKSQSQSHPLCTQFRKHVHISFTSAATRLEIVTRLQLRVLIVFTYPIRNLDSQKSVVDDGWHFFVPQGNGVDQIVYFESLSRCRGKDYLKTRNIHPVN